MFKSLEELRECIEEKSKSIAMQHQECSYCGGSLIDSCGYEEFIELDEYAPDKKFCSEYCLEQHLIDDIGIEEKAARM